MWGVYRKSERASGKAGGMNRQPDWSGMSKALDGLSLKAPIIDGEMDNVSYTRWFKVAFNMEHTADDNAAFDDATYNRDCGYVEPLDYDVDLADNSEWERNHDSR